MINPIQWNCMFNAIVLRVLIYCWFQHRYSMLMEKAIVKEEFSISFIDYYFDILPEYA